MGDLDQVLTRWDSVCHSLQKDNGNRHLTVHSGYALSWQSREDVPILGIAYRKHQSAITRR